jgi:hypothetical protein
MIVIVPILLIVPTMLVLVPPLVVLAPAPFASLVQLVPRLLGFVTGRAMMRDGLVQSVIGVLDAMATFLFFVGMRAGHSGEAEQP